MQIARLNTCDWFNLQAKVVQITNSTVLLSVLANLCTLFWCVGAFNHLYLAVGSSVLPVSSTQHFTLSFITFNSISVIDVDSQLCFPGRL